MFIGIGMGIVGGGASVTPPLWALRFNGTTSNVTMGTDTTVDNLTANAVTWEGWFSPSNANVLFVKSDFSTRGYYLGVGTTSTLLSSTTSPTTVVAHSAGWKHYAFTFDNNGDRKLRCFVNGTLTNTSASAAVGTIVDDGADTLQLMLALFKLNGLVGWLRISNNIRYSANFTPAARNAPPTNDANTVRLFAVDEGIGTVLTDKSTNAINGAIVSAVWELAPLT